MREPPARQRTSVRNVRSGKRNQRKDRGNVGNPNLYGALTNLKQYWHEDFDLEDHAVAIFRIGSHSHGTYIPPEDPNGVALYCVPVLWAGPWIELTMNGSWWWPGKIINQLVKEGSRAVPGYMKPEGIVIFHKASQICFKVTCENDETFKGDKNVSP